ADVAVLRVRLNLPNDLPRLLVERDDPATGRIGEDHAIADRDAAPRLHTLPRVFPFGHAGRSIDRNNGAKRRFDVDHAVDNDGRALIIAAPNGISVESAGSAFDVVEPGGAKQTDVALVDLRQRRVVLVAQVAANFREVVVAGCTARRQGGRLARLGVVIAVDGVT